MVGERRQQLGSGPDPVLTGLRELHQLSKIVDELPQIFIHAQTLPVQSAEASASPCSQQTVVAGSLVSLHRLCHSGRNPNPRSHQRKGHVHATAFAFGDQRGRPDVLTGYIQQTVDYAYNSIRPYNTTEVPPMHTSAKELAATIPTDFTLGVATAAFQIEGALDEDGRGPAGWDVFAAKPGTIVDGHSPAVACDHYHRMPQDVALMKELGIDSYRFSLSWPRIQPGGSGPGEPGRAGLLRPAAGRAPGQRDFPDGDPLPLGHAAAPGRGRRLAEQGHRLPAGGIRRHRRGRVRGPGGPLGDHQRARHRHHQRLCAGPALAGEGGLRERAAHASTTSCLATGWRCRRCGRPRCRAKSA